MKICYYDESGDDGYPKYSSPLFVLSAIYLDHLAWKDIHNQLMDFRRYLKATYGFPVKLEMHTKEFLLDKSPYRDFGYSPADRIEVLGEFCNLIGSLDVRIVNVMINKSVIRHPGYDVLNTSLKYSVQRIENDLNPSLNPDARFIMITDEGRVGKMRKTTRAIQRINYIPSQFSGGAYRQEIQTMIEDPMPKDSKESYYIQLADLVAYLVYLYGMKFVLGGDFPNRLKAYLSPEKLIELITLCKGSFNLEAAPSNEYGIKIHPN